MSNKKIFDVLPVESPVWSFGALILAIIAIIISFFSGTTIIYALVSVVITIPAIIIGVHLLDANITKKGMPIAALICSKAAWVICTILLYLKCIDEVITIVVKHVLKYF